MDAPNETAAPPVEPAKETAQPDFTRFHDAPPVIDTSLDNLLQNEDKAGKPAPTQDAKPAGQQAKPESEKPESEDYQAKAERLEREYNEARAKLDRLEKFVPAVDRLEQDGYKSGDEFISKLEANQATQAQETAISERLNPLVERLNLEIADGVKSLEQAQAELNNADAYLRREMGLLTREQALDAREQAAQQEQHDRAFYEAIMANDVTKDSQEAQNLAFWIASGPDLGGPEATVKAVSEMLAKRDEARDAKRDPEIKSKAIAEYLAQQRGPRSVPVPVGGGNPPPFGAGSNDFMHISLDEAMARQGAATR